jgi:hypothetical protein
MNFENTVYAKPKKAALKRMTKHLKQCLMELSTKDKLPTIQEIIEKVGCDNAKAELILKSVKVKRKQQSSLLGTTLPGMHSTGKEGFIYLIKNSVFDGWVKCGMTVDCGDRLKSYNGYDPLSRFSFIATKEVEDRRHAEKILLNSVSMAANFSNGEWFKIDESICLEIFNKIK